ncbi:MAG TPA: hypothetical protein VF534_22545 [Paraburkholderia sp.]
MEKINEILKYLKNDCKPYRAESKEGPCEHAVEKATIWMLVVSGVFLGLALIFGYSYKLHQAELSKVVGIVSSLLSSLLAVVAVGVRTIMGLIVWYVHAKESNQKDAFDPVSNEIVHDERYAMHLMKYTEEELKRVQHHLKVKVTRIDARVALFFGKEVAIVTGLAAAFTQVKDLGGMSWLLKTFQLGAVPGNYVNSIFLAALAAVAGLALGVIGLKKRQGHYTYRMELVELALLLKSQSRLKAINEEAPESVSA